jgi:hypothetical protein
MAATSQSMLYIVSSGLQDRERLNPSKGNPSITFYTTVFKKRTRWASQWRRVDFDNLADFGRRSTVTVPVLGELITRATLIVQLPDIQKPQLAIAADASAGAIVYPQWSWTNAIGHAICSNIEFTINGQIIDRLDSRLLEVIDEHHAPVEHFDSTNFLIARNPSDYTDTAYKNLPLGDFPPQTLAITFPFWWNRGPGSQSLPIQALAKDKVQITVDFRPVQQCVYTSRITASGLPTFAGSTIYQDISGVITPLGQLPTEWNFLDAYWVMEYISLEDREASALRMADLQIPIEQHIAVPVVNTRGASRIRIPLNVGGLIRDMTWVAQNQDADTYNAYFLFSRDTGPSPQNTLPWWPDALIPNWDYGNGYLRPGFADRRSDPVLAATMWINGKRRFDHEGVSLFRSLIPALNCQRAPLIDRYIYRYDFGFWPSGGLAETLDMPIEEVRGFANWDLLPNKELGLIMNTIRCSNSAAWLENSSYPTIDISNETTVYVIGPEYNSVEGFTVLLKGQGATAGGGTGAIIEGIIDYKKIRAIPGFVRLLCRNIRFGSASIVAELEGNRFIWIAVAGAAGNGSYGGSAGSAVEIGEQELGGMRVHTPSATCGGGGGGRPVGRIGIGVSGGNNGIVMPTNNYNFVYDHHMTGGIGVVNGGDGYYGGGSGILGGGGGGSYVSEYITAVESNSTSINGWNDEASIQVIPLKRTTYSPESFNIYIWLTRYNMLRVTSGHGALMFTS